jgi:hypothetical protein
MDIIPELFRALEGNLGLYKHENTQVLFLSIFPERYWNNHPWLLLLYIVIVRLLCFQGTPILYNVLYIIKLDIFSAADKVWITELTLSIISIICTKLRMCEVNFNGNFYMVLFIQA